MTGSCKDPTLMMIYKISKENIEKVTGHNKKVDGMVDFCDKMKLQFESIIKSNKSGEVRQSTNLTNNGLELVKSQKRKYRSEVKTNQKELYMNFAHDYAERGDNMNWDKCFEEGSADGLFITYTKSLLLKSAIIDTRKN